MSITLYHNQDEATEVWAASERAKLETEIGQASPKLSDVLFGGVTA